MISGAATETLTLDLWPPESDPFISESEWTFMQSLKRISQSIEIWDIAFIKMARGKSGWMDIMKSEYPVLGCCWHGRIRVSGSPKIPLDSLFEEKHVSVWESRRYLSLRCLKTGTYTWPWPYRHQWCKFEAGTTVRLSPADQELPVDALWCMVLLRRTSSPKLSHLNEVEGFSGVWTAWRKHPHPHYSFHKCSVFSKLELVRCLETHHNSRRHSDECICETRCSPMPSIWLVP